MKAIQTKLRNIKFWKNSEVVLVLWKDSETLNKLELISQIPWVSRAYVHANPRYNFETWPTQ